MRSVLAGLLVVLLLVLVLLLGRLIFVLLLVVHGGKPPSCVFNHSLPRRTLRMRGKICPMLFYPKNGAIFQSAMILFFRS